MDARKRQVAPYACEGWEKNCKESSPFCRARERGEAREKLEGFYSKINMLSPIFHTMVASDLLRRPSESEDGSSGTCLGP